MTAHAPGFDVAIIAGSGGVRLGLRGELDLAGVGALDRIVGVVDRTELPFVVDCNDLTFIDGAGIAGLLRAVRVGGTVEGIHGPVQRVLGLVGILELLAGEPAWSTPQRHAS